MIKKQKKSEVLKQLDSEIVFLNSSLEIQKNLNKQILVFTKRAADNLSLDNNGNTDLVYQMNNLMLILNQSNTNIKMIEELINEAETLANDSSDNIEQLISDYYNKYNLSFTEVHKITKKIQDFIYAQQSAHIKTGLNTETAKKTVVKKTKKKQSEQITTMTVDELELDSSFIEKTLVISETQGKIILPYTLNDVLRIFYSNENKYNSIQQVIDEIYTLPIAEYKHSSIARFKEAYKLMTKKEHSSKLKALSLASELFANYNVHPAIIRACNSIDELDIYLACLEENSLKDFKCFDIKYEIPPILQIN